MKKKCQRHISLGHLEETKDDNILNSTDTFQCLMWPATYMTEAYCKNLFSLQECEDGLNARWETWTNGYIYTISWKCPCVCRFYRW